jgi:hypothetical protein
MEFDYSSSGYYHFPFVERTCPEISVMLSSNEMSPEIEQIVNSGINQAFLGPYSAINRLGRRPSRPIPTDSSLMCVFASKMGELTSVWQPFEVERFTKSMA